MAAIAQQPVSVTVEAGAYPFMHYIKGIITDTTCGTRLDHAVTAVGYGTENGQAYYLVKNSWGADWGEQGYVRIGMNGDGAGICGIQLLTLYPTTN
jgi:KDEL-tailed cysteine endopeptidase